LCIYDDYNDKNTCSNTRNSKIDISDKCNTFSDDKLILNVSWINLSYIL